MDKFWCIRVTRDLAPSGEIYLQAESLSAGPTGALYCWGKSGEVVKTYTGPRPKRDLLLVVAPGCWQAFYAVPADDPLLKKVLNEQLGVGA